jgi:primary-amine oxidase
MGRGGDATVRSIPILESFVAESPHPLDPASAEEYLAGREIMAAAGLLAQPVRFAYYGLEEPPKDEVLGGAAAD